MISRVPKEKSELTVESLLSGKGNKIVLEYYLIESEIDDIEELKGMKTYGIEIVKKAENGEVETAMVRNIFNSITETTKVIKTMSNNNVTPISLNYILDDIVGI